MEKILVVKRAVKSWIPHRTNWQTLYRVVPLMTQTLLGQRQRNNSSRIRVSWNPCSPYLLSWAKSRSQHSEFSEDNHWRLWRSRLPSTEPSIQTVSLMVRSSRSFNDDLFIMMITLTAECIVYKTQAGSSVWQKELHYQEILQSGVSKLHTARSYLPIWLFYDGRLDYIS